jgi:hypothetical protein
VEGDGHDLFQDIILSSAWAQSGKLQNTSDRIPGNPAEIQIGYLQIPQVHTKICDTCQMSRQLCQGDGGILRHCRYTVILKR